LEIRNLGTGRVKKVQIFGFRKGRGEKKETPFHLGWISEKEGAIRVGLKKTG